MSEPLTARFDVEGMSCAACAGRVERAVKAVPGVVSASVNLATHSLSADYAGDAGPAGIAAAVTKAGYGVSERESRLEIEGMSCASCVGRIERALKALPGVTGADVNLASGGAVVRYYVGALEEGDLIRAVERAGYAASVPAGAEAEAPRDRFAAEAAAQKRHFALALVLTLPVFLLAMGSHFLPGVHHLIDSTMGEQTSWIVQFVLTSAVLIWPGRQFLTHGFPALWRRAPDMNSLVALGATAAWAYSTVATFLPGVMPAGAVDVYFEAAAVIVALILLGRWLEARAKGRAGQAIAHLVGLRPDTAHVRRGGGTEDLPLAQLKLGDLIEIRPGERIAADGIVREGQSWVDTSMLTGEPAPVATGPGAEVTGGTVNGNGALVVEVTRLGAEATLNRIIRMVSDAQGGKLPIQGLVDRVTLWFVPGVLAVALVTVALWLALGPGIGHALVAGVAVLIIACPCAMGLATPVSIMVGTGRGAELGLLFRKGEALQRLEEARVVAFDKTGTLTEGQPKLTDLTLAEGFDEAKLLAQVAAVEARSEHPVARAILAAAEARGLVPDAAEDFAMVPGYGVSARVGGAQIAVGADRMMARDGVDLGPLAEAGARLAAEGKTPLYAAVDGRAAAVIAVSDPVKPGARAALAALGALGVKTAMVTGDNRATAEHIAQLLGIDHVVAEVLPEGKVAAIEDLRARFGAVAFVGDGINDAPALAAADVGLAIGTGTDVAIETADLVLSSGDPGGVAQALRLSRAVMRNIRQNLGWAFGYNIALVPVAAGLLYPLWGIMLSPMLAAGAMAASSVLVVSNALRLRRFGRGAQAVEGRGTVSEGARA